MLAICLTWNGDVLDIELSLAIISLHLLFNYLTLRNYEVVLFLAYDATLDCTEIVQLKSMVQYTCIYMPIFIPLETAR